MGFAYRKISKLITTWEEIRRDGNVWSFDIYASIRHGKHVYIVGEELEETTLDGRHVSVSILFISCFKTTTLYIQQVILTWRSSK